ncbi:GNAT family N-acetyltransferase [Gracilibacillus massiliensis]|uniref:GNAT family N-acetyltransferase n=1 Tax=Gracilibacillus massiliensis TaxID=1564956 RepID=UPI00071D9EDD|nr:GNAT family N-acetyltransferase [Gracilibacillus massiliensis]
MEIKIVNTDQELKDAYQVRSIVFVEEQGVPEELEIDDLEKEAVHFVGYHGKNPVAASRMRFVDDYAKLERVCVLADNRGKGYGKDIIFFMEKVAKEKGLEKSKLNGQIHAEAFYQSLGYKTISDEFMDAGIPHVTMIKSIL